MGGDHDSLIGCYHLIRLMCLYGDMTGVVIYSVELGLNGIGEWTAVQRLIRLQRKKIII